MYRLRLRRDDGTVRPWRDFVLNELLKRDVNERFDMTALYTASTSGILLIALLERRINAALGSFGCVGLSSMSAGGTFAILFISLIQVCNAVLMVSAHIGERGLLAKRGCVMFVRKAPIKRIMVQLGSRTGSRTVLLLLLRSHLCAGTYYTASTAACIAGWLICFENRQEENILQLWNVVFTVETLKNVIASVTRNFHVRSLFC